MLTKESLLDAEKLQKVAMILKTIAHPMRIEIIDLLSNYEKLSVNELTERLGAEQSLVSHHLATMKQKGILKATRDGKKIIYELKLTEVLKVIDCMHHCELKLP